MEKISRKFDYAELPHGNVALDRKVPTILAYFKAKFPGCVELKDDERTFSIKILGQVIWFKVHYINGNKTGNNKVCVRIAKDQCYINNRVSKKTPDKVFEIKENYTLSDGSSRIDLNTAGDIAKLIAFKFKKLADEKQKATFTEQLDQMKLLGIVTRTINEKYECSKYPGSKTDVLVAKDNKEIARFYKTSNADLIRISVSGSYGYMSVSVKPEEFKSYLPKFNNALECIDG